jgi:hypothetical protein
MTIRLFDEATDVEIGTLTEDQFQLLQDVLEEENADDDDYYINQDTIDMLDGLVQRHVAVVNLLRTAIGPRSEMDIRWQRDPEPSESVSE